MTTNDFRDLALSLPETVESAHMDHPDFRVKGKIFATLWPDEVSGVVMLTPEQQEAFVKSEPGVFVPVKGGWGRRGATIVQLDSAKRKSVREALVTAWRNKAPKRLVKEFEGE